MDGDNLVAEYDGANNLLHRYVHGPGVDNPLGANPLRPVLAADLKTGGGFVSIGAAGRLFQNLPTGTLVYSIHVGVN